MLRFDVMRTPESASIRSLLAIVAPAVILGLVFGAPAAGAAPDSPAQTVERARSLFEGGKEEKAARVIRNGSGLESKDPAVTEALRDLLAEARTALRTADRPKRVDGARILLCTVRYRLGVAETAAGGAGRRAGDAPPRRGDDPGITPPERIHAPMPEYTRAAASQRYEGAIVTQVIIDEEGCVASAKLLVDSGHELDVGDRTVETQATWVFRPALLDDQPVAVYYNLTTNFAPQ